ncbi:CocE/NonD family hydrolase [Ramlibacter sp. AW1]|uniref:CocE/NonD family hydrolase n=1 Tax=Ramlibacter aurantiacus TaxID=2801330 RepID=A0A937D2H0_9BURK|nr:CocE/NonD family hydrolase [Ramlibacter aurantiacus]MBL0421609.1 CocE/NonD family hydrolase [Ramlibacter aurantiacus]
MTTDQPFEMAWCRARHPSEILKWEHGWRQTRDEGMLIEWDVGVPMRDGVKIFIDVFRPDHGQPVPALIAWGPYGKQSPRGVYERFANNGGVRPEWMSKYTSFEAPDPVRWTQMGYAIIHVDPRGLWNSGGDATFWSADEARDFYDLIEWAAVQPWCTGKIGLTGVSYLTIAQWQVAALRPPHLAAINPWEGYSDSYRERAFHGGIPEDRFMPRWLQQSVYAKGLVEDVLEMRRRHPFYDAYWQGKAPDLSMIEVPAYVVASWSDQGLHTRGTLEGFKRISSRHKWLEVHGRKKWEHFMRPEMVEKQRAFFDHFLKGSSDEVLGWPTVNLEIRERFYVGPMRAEAEWPLARTAYTPLYLDAASGGLGPARLDAATQARYDPAAGRAVFQHRFGQDTELTGHMKLRLWVQTTEGDDMDLFIVVYKLDADGRQVPLSFFSVFEEGPVAMGWLRVSHRELDPERSTPHQPVLAHQRELRLQPDEIVPVDIEIWPSSMLYRAGESLQLVVQGRDIDYGPAHMGPTMAHGPLRNAGEHVLHTGGEFDAHLLVPVIPPRA